MANIQERKKSFSAQIETNAYKNLITQTIPDEKQRNRFKAAILSAVAVNPALRECESGTILAAAFLGESLGLSPSPQLGQYYMIPFENTKKEVTEAVFVLGYKGYIQMSVRSGQYKKIIVSPVKEGELIRYNSITEEIILNPIDDDIKREAAKTIGYYARIELTSGFVKEMYWSKEKMLIHADRYSKAFSMGPATARNPKYNKVSYEDYTSGRIPKGTEWLYSSFWYKDFDVMAMKTMIRQIIGKWGVMSQELSDGFIRDDAAIHLDGTYEVAEIELAGGNDLNGAPDENTGEEKSDTSDNNQKPSDDDINKQGSAGNGENEDQTENITFDEL